MESLRGAGIPSLESHLRRQEVWGGKIASYHQRPSRQVSSTETKKTGSPRLVPPLKNF